MNGLRSRCIRFNARLRFGRHHRRTGRPGGITSGAVIGHCGRLDLRLVPWTVIDDQHAQYTENGDRNRPRQRRTAAPRRMVLSRMVVQFHFESPVDSRVGNQIPAMPIVPVQASRQRCVAEQITPSRISSMTPSAFGRCRCGSADTEILSTEIPLQPNMAERAIDTATDVSRTITDVSAALQVAVDRLSEAIATARQPGKPLATISAITREAPLASLFVAFLFGVAVARRH